jgi:hypothetical protein
MENGALRDAKKVLKELLYSCDTDHPAVQAQERVIKFIIKQEEK